MSMENPYSAPLSAVADVGARDGDAFRSPHLLRNTLLVLIIAHVLILLLTIIVMAFLRQSLQQFAGHEFVSQQAMRAELRGRGALQAAMSLVQILVLLVTYVISGMWIYRVACNVRALGAKGLDDTPGWAVGWYFIPFLCLQRPFRAMEQIWLASQSPLRWQKLATPALLRLWWGLWLAVCFAGYLVMRMTGASHSVTAMIGNESLLMGSHALSIAAELCFLAVVLRVTRLQLEQSDHVAAPAPGIDMARLPSVGTD